MTVYCDGLAVGFVSGFTSQTPTIYPEESDPADHDVLIYPVLFKGSVGSLNALTTTPDGAPGNAVVSTALAATVIVNVLVGSPLIPDGVTAINDT